MPVEVKICGVNAPAALAAAVAGGADMKAVKIAGADIVAAAQVYCAGSPKVRLWAASGGSSPHPFTTALLR